MFRIWKAKIVQTNVVRQFESFLAYKSLTIYFHITFDNVSFHCVIDSIEKQAMAEQGPTGVLSSKLDRIEMLFFLYRIEIGLR